MLFNHLTFANYSDPENSDPYFGGVPIYIDKDELIAPLLKGIFGRQLIFSRPSGFGRTTTINRMKYLALKQKRPVLILDVKECEHLEDLACPQIRELITSGGPDLVLLIDNYDYPLTSSLPKGPDDDGPYLKAAQQLSSALNTLLNCAAHSNALTFITGTMHFEKNLLLNSESLVDLTCERFLTELMGYTQGEFSYYFAGKIASIAMRLHRMLPDLEYMLYHHLCRYNFVPGSEVRLYSPGEIAAFFAAPEKLIQNGMAVGARLTRALQPMVSQLTAPANTYFCGLHTLSRTDVLRGLTSLRPEPLLTLFQFGLFTLPPAGNTLSNVSTPRMAGMMNEIILRQTGVDVCECLLDFIERNPLDTLMITDYYCASEVLEQIWQALRRHGLSVEYNHPEYWKIFLCLMLPLSSIFSCSSFEMKDCPDNLHSPFVMLQFKTVSVLILLFESKDSWTELRDLKKCLERLSRHCPPDSLLGLYPEAPVQVRAILCNKKRRPHGFVFENLTWMVNVSRYDEPDPYCYGDIQPVQLRPDDDALMALRSYRMDHPRGKIFWEDEEMAIKKAARFGVYPDIAELLGYTTHEKPRKDD